VRWRPSKSNLHILTQLRPSIYGETLGMLIDEQIDREV
jgi:hypothetical protein